MVILFDFRNWTSCVRKPAEIPVMISFQQPNGTALYMLDVSRSREILISGLTASGKIKDIIQINRTLLSYSLSRVSRNLAARSFKENGF